MPKAESLEPLEPKPQQELVEVETGECLVPIIMQKSQGLRVFHVVAVPVTIMGIYRDNGKENGNYYNGLYRDYRVYVGAIWG